MAVGTRPNWREYYLDIARAVSARAACTHRKVGAVLVSGHSIKSTGYNGSLPGHPECLNGACPRGRGESMKPDYSDCIFIHAEDNALRRGHGNVMYITDAPCYTCMILMYEAGIKKVFWPDGEFMLGG